MLEVEKEKCSSTIEKNMGSIGRRKIVVYAILSRFLVLSGMILSCALIPDFNPGDDVDSFDMRFNDIMAIPKKPMEIQKKWPIGVIQMFSKGSTSDDFLRRRHRCFCLEGHACDMKRASSRSWSTEDSWSESTERNGRGCADKTNHYQEFIEFEDTSGIVMMRFALDYFYELLLLPLTRWDAARFLNIAVDPLARHPEKCGMMKVDKGNKMTCSFLEKDFIRSERAHAFLPLVPLLIRYTAKMLIQMLPTFILPPTFESVIVLSALLLNIIFFIGSAVSLFELTRLLLLLQLQKHDQHDFNDNKKSEKDDNNVIKNNCDTNIDDIKKGEKSNISTVIQLEAPMIAACIFCFNPASVFFTSCYSESTFAFLTFVGHLFAIKNNSIMATMCWMLSSYARSNGAITSVLHIIVLACVSITRHLNLANVAIPIVNVENDNKKKSKGYKKGMSGFCSNGNADYIVIIAQCACIVLYHMALVWIAVIPLAYHDKKGYDFHCSVAMSAEPMSHQQQTPDWCMTTNTNRDKMFDNRREKISNKYFSLYAFVQRKHWNVGFLRYYEWKQIPNFILATPILLIGICATLNWIHNSYLSYCNSRDSTKRFHISPITCISGWVEFAFYQLSSSSSIVAIEGSGCRDRRKIMIDSYGDDEISKLLIASNMLVHYATLACFCLVGITVAHVQISTRMICSSCPAIYWYMTTFFLQRLNKHQQQSQLRNICCKWRQKKPLILICYFISFNVLGIIMHVNWLPWT